MINWENVPWDNNRWGMDIDYVPVTIGADDGTPYEEIYATVAEFVTAWTGNTVNNVVLYFSDPNDYVEDDDPSLNPINQDETYYLNTYTKGVFRPNFRNNLSLNLALEL